MLKGLERGRIARPHVTRGIQILTKHRGYKRGIVRPIMNNLLLLLLLWINWIGGMTLIELLLLLRILKMSTWMLMCLCRMIVEFGITRRR